MAVTEAHRHDPLEPGCLRVVVATIVINVVVVGLLTLAPWSDWRTGAALNAVDNLILAAFIVGRRDQLLGRFIVMGLAVGFVELAADAWLVDYTRTLDYSIGGGPMLWRSPIWMPLAWEVVTVQFGYVGLRLWERFGARGLLLTGVLGALNIPYYEEMARRIHWWEYSGCRMVSYTPYYIILGEFGIAALLGLLATRLRKWYLGHRVAGWDHRWHRDLPVLRCCLRDHGRLRPRLTLRPRSCRRQRTSGEARQL